jgi:hypothetical protein
LPSTRAIPDRDVFYAWRAEASAKAGRASRALHSFAFLLSWILDVMYANAPYTVIQRAMHIHPAQQFYGPQLSTITSQLL